MFADIFLRGTVPAAAAGEMEPADVDALVVRAAPAAEESAHDGAEPAEATKPASATSQPKAANAKPAAKTAASRRKSPRRSAS
jgi:hypothetical protein